MSDMTRRSAALLALLAPFATVRGADASTAPSPTAAPGSHMDMDMGTDASKYPKNVHWYGSEEIAMLMYPGMTVMDLIGPQSMFAAMMGAKIHLVAKTMHPVTSDAGVTITPTATFETCPRNLTVLFMGGGTDGTLAAARDRETLAFIADRGARAKYVTSVCSGSLILGAAGLLRGYRATSHWSCRDALAGFGAIPVDARVVFDRNRVTGAGVTSGLDLGLAMVDKLRDKFYAECTQLVSEYAPQPPYDAGSLHTAPADVRASMTELLSVFSKKARQLAYGKAHTG